MLEARVADLASLEAAGALLGDLGDGASLDRDEQRIAVPTRQGIPALVTAARRLDDADIALADLGLRRPSLDDVFFAITGDRAEPIALDLARPSGDCNGRGARRPSGHRCSDGRSRTRRSSPGVRSSGTSAHRRCSTSAPPNPSSSSSCSTPSSAGSSRGAQGGSYVQYLLPGVIVMNVLLGASVTAAGMAEDLRDGIVDRFRSLPISRVAVLVGRTLADLARNTIALAFLVVVGAFMGFRFDGGVPRRSGVSCSSCSSPSPCPGCSRSSAWR